jgi:iron complex outermembrane receptor protein
MYSKFNVPRVNLLAAAIAIAFSSVAADISAAETADTSTLDTVIVTGTRAKDRTVLESAVPVDVLTADDLRASGAVNGELGAALATLLPSFNFPRQSNSGGSDHVRAAQLRGLSPDQVLVLINGKRVHTSALVNTDTKVGRGTTPVDFNAIPISAIKRIEVLRDGAGAQYGSDAIAGVINIILDDKPEGGEFNASYGAFHTDFKPIDKTLTDGQSTYASATFGTRLGEEGFLRFGLEGNKHNATNRAGYDQIPYWENQSPENLALQGKRNYKAGDPDLESYTGWFNGELPLSESLALYAFGTYNARHSVGANYFRYPDGDAAVPAIFPNGYRPESIGSLSDVQTSAGARGRAGVWNYDASLSYGANHFDYGLRNSLNVSLGEASPTSFKSAGYNFEQSVANLDFTREVGFGERVFVLALGGEFRHEAFNTEAGDPASYAVGPVIGAPIGAQAGANLTPADVARLSRDVSGIYADLGGNLTDKLFVDFAARYEHYSDFGGELTGKFSARYEITPAFAIRGALSNNFRAPSLSQIGFESTSTGYGADGQLTQGRVLSVNNPIARALGAKPLEPEKSVNASLGFTARAGDTFDVSFDLFHIDIDKRVTLSERIGGDAIEQFILDNFGVSGVQQVAFFTNAVDTRARGAELVANWRPQIPVGALALTGAYSYTDTSIRKVRATPQELVDLGADNVLFGVEERNTLTDAAPRQRASVAAKWDVSRWSLSSRLTRQGSTTRVFNFGGGFEPRQAYGAKWQLDAEVEFRATDALSFALGGNNITDQYPDRSIDDIAYFGNFPYDVISPIGLNGAYWYGRVRYAF